LQGTQHDQRSDSGPGQFGGHILCDACKTQHLDVELLPNCLRRFQVLTGNMLQPENQGLAGDRLLNGVDRGPRAEREWRRG